MKPGKRPSDPTVSGILLVNKCEGNTSFSLVRQLRRLTNEKRIGHAGTLDPFATGVMVMLIGRAYTRLSNTLLNHDKEYLACIRLGATTDTFDRDGQITSTSDAKPPLEEIESALSHFQGWVNQVPPMYSAKKVKGQKLYQLARRGEEIERQPVRVHMDISLIAYRYPDLHIRIACSKGTYVRALAHDLGRHLSCGGHLTQLQRSRSGPFHIEQCLKGELLSNTSLDVRPHLIRQVPCAA